MNTIVMNNKDEVIMKLVHYFITEENYTPIVVRGVTDEIWLENDDAPYKIIRINSNYIHNDEQYKFDLFKTKSVMKQIKRKTLSLSMNALNIHLNLGDNVNIKDSKNVNAINIKDGDNIAANEGLQQAFPKIKDKILADTSGINLLINVTSDINRKNEENNMVYEKTFRKKPIVVTWVLMAVCVICFILEYVLGDDVVRNFAVYGKAIKSGEVWRIITGTFLHGDIFHLGFNMYALYVIGSQVETFFGKAKYIGIYLGSAIFGSLMSILFNTGLSIGASGAIFGLMGCILYFGYYYRLYLGSVLKNQIIPVILLNLVLGFMPGSGIDNAAHIGGLVGGFFITKAFGVNERNKKSDKINGWILTIIFMGFLIYMNFFLSR